MIATPPALRGRVLEFRDHDGRPMVSPSECPLCSAPYGPMLDAETGRGHCSECGREMALDDLAKLADDLPFVLDGRRKALASMVGVLVLRRVPARMVRILAESWGATHCRPPLDTQEVREVLDWLASREVRGRRAA